LKINQFTCPVVRVAKSAKHPNADTLRIWNGPQGPIAYKAGTIADGSLAVFVPLDSIVDCSRPEFGFLKADKEGQTTSRVRPIKLRGVPSVGLLVPAGEGLNEGDDASAALGVTKYVQPQVHSFGTTSLAQKAPSDVYGLPTYDVENVWNIEKFAGPNGINSDTKMDWHVSEKIHGCNMRITYADGKFHVGSKNRWVENDLKSNCWTRAFAKVYDRLNDKEKVDFAKYCSTNVLIGECYGSVQDLHYGLPNDVDFVLFDVYGKKDCEFLPPDAVQEVHINYSVNRVPDLSHIIPPNVTLAEAVDTVKQWEHRAKSRYAQKWHDVDQLSEGYVIRPLNDDLIVNGSKGPTRLIVKVINEEYHQRNNGTENNE